MLFTVASAASVIVLLDTRNPEGEVIVRHRAPVDPLRSRMETVTATIQRGLLGPKWCIMRLGLRGSSGIEEE